MKPGLLTFHSHSMPAWAILSLMANGLLLALVLWSFKGRSLPSAAPTPALATQPILVAPTPVPNLELGPRHKLTYEQWIDLLAQEARVVAEQQPHGLSILVGDSISLWFPYHLLPDGQSWLNQGISGETSAGLLQRLHLFDATQPDTIFVLIGINDLIRGVPDAEILANQQEIIRYLKAVHPRSRIVVQSILPHADAQATWEGRDRLLAIPNPRIRDLNVELRAIATDEGVYYLDLYSLFADAEGSLRTDLTTDGLHLNHQGYLVWRVALQMFSRTELGEAARTW